MIADFLHRHRAGVLLLTFASFSLLCMTLRVGPYVTGLKSTLWFLFSPEVVYSGEFLNKLDSLNGRLFGLVHAEGENYILRYQNSQLAKKVAERDALEEENNRLRKLLNLRQRAFPEGIAAEVVGRDVREWFHAVVINKGSADNITVSAAAVAGLAERPMLVGRVVEVGQKTGKILLVTDSLSAISVSVGKTGDMGLLEGCNRPWIALRYLPQKSDIAPGDEVVTAGMGGIFPPGILVGQVESVSESADGFFMEAKVVPSADLNSLREVMILQRKELPLEPDLP